MVVGAFKASGSGVDIRMGRQGSRGFEKIKINKESPNGFCVAIIMVVDKFALFV